MTTADVLEAELSLLGPIGRARLLVSALIIRLALVLAPAPVTAAATAAAEEHVDDEIN